MKNTYKELFDGIKPDEKLVDSVFEMRLRKKNKRLAPKIISAVLAVAVIAGGIGYSLNNNAGEVQDDRIGGVMTANASESIGESSVEICYGIRVKNIEGLNENELYDAKIEMLRELGCDINDEDSLKNDLKHNVTVNGNVLYSICRGFTIDGDMPYEDECDFVLRNIENPENVKKITVSNDSEYGNSVINCNDLYYTEFKNNRFLFKNIYTDTDKTYMVGHNLSVDGSRYAKCRKIEGKKAKRYCIFQDEDKMTELNGATGPGTVFYISYEFSDAFFDALGEDPDMDLTTYKDNLTVRVDFKDGNTATTVLELGMNANGYLTAKCLSYDYSKTK